MVKLKICGMVQEQDIAAVNTVLPDYAGFVFAQSKRRIDGRKAKALKAGLDPFIKAVGVFVNEDIKNIQELCSSGVIDLIQLHGDENEEYIKELKKCTSNKIIKAVRVRDAQDIKRAAGSLCDYLLLDAYQDGKYGGIGRTFDWSVIPKLEKPFFLAGGIDSGNIARAIGLYDPYCIDVSSGVETDGYKDPEKISAIAVRIRRFNSTLFDKK